MAKRLVVIGATGSGADEEAPAGGHMRITPHDGHADGSTWIHASAESYFFLDADTSVLLTVGQFYWFQPVNPKGDTILAEVTAGSGSLLYKDLVPVDPSTLLPPADAEAAWYTALTSGLAGTQPLDAELTTIAGLAPSDGQALVWSSTLGTWTVANPTGSSLLASNMNASGLPTGISATGGIGTSVSIPSTTIVVPNSNGRPVYLEWEAAFAQTTVGLGTVWLEVYEGATLIASTEKTLPNSITAGQAQISIPLKSLPIGAVTTTRTFSLYALLYSPAANNPAGTILNTTYEPSILKAIAY